MLRVGVTGEIGAGKSTAARRLIEHGAMLTGHECFGCQVAEHGTSRLTATDANHEAAAVLVEDAPPGIGRGAASMYHLVVYIDAPADDRVRRVERLVKDQEL